MNNTKRCSEIIEAPRYSSHGKPSINGPIRAMCCRPLPCTIHDASFPTSKPNFVKPIITTDGGPWVSHDKACAVFYNEESAVYDIGQQTFQPSWKAQSRGWKLVHADNWLRKLVLKWIFE